MDGRLSDDPTGRAYAWQKLSQAELDQIAHDSRKQRQARLMKDPPKCSYCPKARLTSLTMLTTHCQSKVHRIRVREFQKSQKRELQTSLARAGASTRDPSGNSGQSSGDSANATDAPIPTCNDADKGVDTAEAWEKRIPQPGQPDLGDSRGGKKSDSGNPHAEKVEAATAGQTSGSQDLNTKDTNLSTKKNPSCSVCHGSTLRRHSWKSHLLSTKHMKAVRKLMKTWSGSIQPSTETDVLSAMDPYCWGAAMGAEEERDEEAEEEEEEEEKEDISILPASLDGDSHDSLGVEDVDMDLSE